MHFMTFNRDPKDPNKIEVHLDFASPFRAVVQSIGWYALFVFLGMALHRAYVHLFDF